MTTKTTKAPATPATLAAKHGVPTKTVRRILRNLELKVQRETGERWALSNSMILKKVEAALKEYTPRVA